MAKYLSPDQARIAIQRQAWQAYYGNLPRPLRSRSRQVDDSVSVNRLRSIVDKGASFLFGQPVRFEADPAAPQGAQDWLDAMWEANRQPALLKRLAISGGVTGHAALKVIPSQPYPRLTIVDATILAITHAPGDIEDVTRYAITIDVQDDEGNPSQRRETIAKDGQGWVIQQQQGDGKGGWITTATQPWQHTWAPIFHCQNLESPSEVFGQSDIPPDVIQLNTDLNFVLSNVSRIIRFHANPKVVGKGFTANQMVMGPDDMIILPSKDSDLVILNPAADLTSSLAFARELSSRMDELTRIPSLALGLMTDVPRGAVSGLAIGLLYQPLIEKTGGKQVSYGAMLCDLCSHLLELAGFGAGIKVTAHWPDLMPSDDLTAAQAAVAWLQVGVSPQTLMAKAGFDPVLEAQHNTAPKDVPNGQPQAPVGDEIDEGTGSGMQMPNDVAVPL